MKRVFVCSPYAGDIKRNVTVAENVCRMAIKQGHAPFAPHLLYPRFVDDLKLAERQMGIACGLKYMEICDEVWVFTGNGISTGMRQEIAYAKSIGKPVIEIESLEDLGETEEFFRLSA